MNSLTSTDDSGDKSEFTSNLGIFRQIDFFSSVSIEVMKLFAFLCQRHLYKTGDIIFHQGDDDPCCYYILSGSAELILRSGGSDRLIREYSTESFLGILSLMAPMTRQFSLIAKEDTTCLVMTRKAFSKVVDQFPEIPLKIAHTVGHRLLQAEKKSVSAFESKQRDGLKNLMGISLI